MRIIRNLLALIILSLLFILPVKADYSYSFTVYSSFYAKYRQSMSQFNVAKSTYQTYQTLAAQNAAIISFKQVVSDRNNLIGAYYDLLSEKLATTEQIDRLDIVSFYQIRQSEKNWLAENQAKINGAAIISDLNQVSAEFANRYPQMLLESKQIIGKILLAKGTALDKQLNASFSDMNAVISTVSAGGAGTTVLERGVIQAKIKKDLFTQKQSEERSYFFPGDRYQRDQLDLLKGQQIAVEANQYLREAANFLLEVIKSITG